MLDRSFRRVIFVQYSGGDEIRYGPYNEQLSKTHDENITPGSFFDIVRVKIYCIYSIFVGTLPVIRGG